MSKIYAVANGRTTGLLYTLGEFRESVVKYPSPVCKSFKDEMTAKQWLTARFDELSSEKNKAKTEAPACVFIDGSYNKKDNTYGFAAVFRHDEQETVLSGKSNSYAELRNVAGEIRAALVALRYSRRHNIKKFTIYYDFKDLHNWITGKAKCHHPFVQRYINAVNQARATGFDISFVYTEGHSGIEGNEKADKLAKKAANAFFPAVKRLKGA